jgi:cyanate permease
MLAIGFSMAAAGPVFLGALRDLAGGFEARIAVLAALAAAAEVLALTAVPRRGRSMVETPL